MELTRVILGPVVTEKAERLKLSPEHRTYTLRIANDATKVDVKNALEKFYGVEVTSVRMLRVPAKSRPLTQHAAMEKRHSFKKMMVTLAKKSKALDLSAFELAA